MKKVLLIPIFLCYTGIFILGSKLDLEEKKEVSFVVKATMYTVSPNQTDDSPLVTASGFKLHPKNPKKHRIIAVSRDLVDSLGFGTKVRLENAGKYNGVYVIEDVMNKRFKRRIDILINPKDKAISLESVKITMVE